MNRSVIINVLCLSCLFLPACRKGSSPSPASVLRKMNGAWLMHGTSDQSTFNGTTYVYTHDTFANLPLTIYAIDDTTILYYLNGLYSVYWVNHSNASSIVFQCDGIVPAANALNYYYTPDSLVFQCYYDYGTGGRYQQTLSSAPGHMQSPPNQVSDDVAKMAGTHQWHGTEQTEYQPASGPNIDTTYNITATFRISAISDTLITVWGANLYFYYSNYLVFRRTASTASELVFTCQDQAAGTFTYYPASNNLYYFDSSTGYIRDVTRLYYP